MRRLLLWMGGLLTVMDMQAQTQIAVLSDIHVMAPELLVNDGPAWQATLAKERKMIDLSSQVFDEVVDRIKEAKPNLLLITGDLTKDSETASHQYVKSRLDQLAAEGIRSFVIPGNHDLSSGNAFYYDGEAKTPAETLDANGFAKLYEAYGYGAGSLRDANSLSYVCEPVAGLRLIGIDSHSGKLPAETLDWICTQARTAVTQGKQVIAMMHHPLFQHINNADMFVSTSSVENYEEVRNRIADAGIRVILTGHFHVSDIAKDYNADLSRDIYDVNTGSTISYPCDYRMMTLSADLSELGITTEHVTTLPSDGNFEMTAYNRLHQSMYQIAMNKTGNETLAELLAAIFIVHAKGNEHQSDDAANCLTMFKMAKSMTRFNPKIAETLAAYGQTWESVEAVLNSILKDISNYGIEGRANQTDDLTLAISHQPSSN